MLSVIALWVGIAFTIVAISARGVRLSRRGATVPGVVLKSVMIKSLNGAPIPPRSLVGYTLRDGREMEAWIWTGSLLSVGTSVQVMYDPDDISNVDLG